MEPQTLKTISFSLSLRLRFGNSCIDQYPTTSPRVSKMPSRSTEADIEYQRVDRNSPEISPPSPPTFVNDFELDVTNAFELDDFPE